jgi:hypothetical protein
MAERVPTETMRLTSSIPAGTRGKARSSGESLVPTPIGPRILVSAAIALAGPPGAADPAYTGNQLIAIFAKDKVALPEAKLDRGALSAKGYDQTEGPRSLHPVNRRVEGQIAE